MASRGSESEVRDLERRLDACEVRFTLLDFGSLCAGRGERARSRCLSLPVAFPGRGERDLDRDADLEYDFRLWCLRSDFLPCVLSSSSLLCLRLCSLSRCDVDFLDLRLGRSSSLASCLLLRRSASSLLSLCVRDRTSAPLSRSLLRRLLSCSASVSLSSRSCFECRGCAALSLTSGVSRPSAFFCFRSSALRFSLCLSRFIDLRRAFDSSASLASSAAL